MEPPLNGSPDLSMSDITRKLFNNKFLSDIQFHIAGHRIYAHSLELMKRSTVFQAQLETTLGDTKLIPIVGVNYESFYKFIYFIYTDECQLTRNTVFELCKLAITYKMPKLESITLEFLSQWPLQLFDMCIRENLTLPLERAKENLSYNLSDELKSDHFLSIHPNALEQILTLNRANVNEVELFNALARWVQQYSARNGIKMTERFTTFSKYVRLIRYCAMSDNEFEACVLRDKHLFPDHFSDSIRDQIVVTNLTGRVGRGTFTYPYEFLTYRSDETIHTKFSVTRHLHFTGIRYGNSAGTRQTIVLLGKDLATNTTNIVEFNNPPSLTNPGSRMVSFSNFLTLRPNTEYTLDILYHCPDLYEVLCCSAEMELRIVAPHGTVHLTKSCKNIIEMHFIIADDLINL